MHADAQPGRQDTTQAAGCHSSARACQAVRPGKGGRASSTPRLVAAILAASTIARPAGCARPAAMRFGVHARSSHGGGIFARLDLGYQPRRVLQNRCSRFDGEGGRFIELLVASFDIQPEGIPLLIVHESMVSLACHASALHGAELGVRPWTVRSALWMTLPGPVLRLPEHWPVNLTG